MNTGLKKILGILLVVLSLVLFYFVSNSIRIAAVDRVLRERISIAYPDSVIELNDKGEFYNYNLPLNPKTFQYIYDVTYNGLKFKVTYSGDIYGRVENIIGYSTYSHNIIRQIGVETQYEPGRKVIVDDSLGVVLLEYKLSDGLEIEEIDSIVEDFKVYCTRFSGYFTDNLNLDGLEIRMNLLHENPDVLLILEGYTIKSKDDLEYLQNQIDKVKNRVYNRLLYQIVENNSNSNSVIVMDLERKLKEELQDSSYLDYKYPKVIEYKRGNDSLEKGFIPILFVYSPLYDDYFIDLSYGVPTIIRSIFVNDIVGLEESGRDGGYLKYKLNKDKYVLLEGFQTLEYIKNGIEGKKLKIYDSVAFVNMDYDIVETRGSKWIRLSELLEIFDWKFESIDSEKLVIYQR